MSLRRFDLTIKRVVCVDETEHEGVWFISGEGVANDHMLLNAITLTADSGGREREAMSRRIDLGDDYEDGRSVSMDRTIASAFVADEEQHPVAVNVGLLLVEEDYAGDMGKDLENALRTYAEGSKEFHGIASLVFAAIGGKAGKIGSAAAKVASILEPLVTKAIADMANDLFPMQDVSLRIESPTAEFDRGGRDVQVRFTDTKIGGTYDLHFEWNVTRIAGPNGTRPLFRWFSPSRGDNFTTSNPNWCGGPRDVQSGYRFSRLEGFVFKSAEGRSDDGKVPLYSWWSPSRGDNFLTSNPRWGADRPREQDGYVRYRHEGDIFRPDARPEGAFPLLSWWSPARGDNFATTDRRWRPDNLDSLSIDERGMISDGPERSGYRLYRLEGWVPQPS